MELEGTIDRILVKKLAGVWYSYVLKEHPNLFWATQTSLPLRKGDYVKIITMNKADKPIAKMAIGAFSGGYIRELKAYKDYKDNEPFLEFSGGLEFISEK